MRAQQAALAAIEQSPAANAARRANAYGDMGKLLMAAALHDAAEPHLRRAQTLAPDDARWPYYLGHLYRTTGALEESVAAFNQVLSIRPDDPLTLLWLGEVHLLLGRPEEADPLFRTQLVMQPDSVVAHVGIGRAALAANDYARAVEFLEEGLRLSGQTAVGVHYPLALAYRGLGRLDRAAAHMRQRADVAILAEDPLMEELDTLIESPRAYERRGNRALSRRDWVAAAGYFRRGLVLEPADSTLRHRLGTVLFQMGDPGGAFAEFERILQSAPDFALAHFSLGVLLEGAGRRPEAIARFEAAARHEPAYVEARLALAGLLRREGRFEDALVQYERVMEEGAPGDPRIEEAPFGHAIALVRLGRHGDARNRFGEGMTAYPDQPSSSTRWRVSSAAQPIRRSGTAPAPSRSWRGSRRPPAPSTWASRWPWPWRQPAVSARRRIGSGTPSTGPRGAGGRTSCRACGKNWRTTSAVSRGAVTIRSSSIRFSNGRRARFARSLRRRTA